MKVKLKGILDPDLESLGLEIGDEIEVSPDPISKVGCVHFTRGTHNCSLWPENYEVINPRNI